MPKSFIKHLFFLQISVLFSLTVSSQNQVITGKVVEMSTREPMQFASVTLFEEADTIAAIQGSATDGDGNFMFEQVKPGNYFVSVSFIGYKNARTSIFKHEEFTKLGTIEIEASEILLEDVIITGKQDILSHNIDKKVYQVGQDILSESGSATEILQNIPSVTVDVNGNVSLRGTSNILFLVNGRPSALLRRSSATALQQIPAATIDRIEVITNPSAKYKPDGTGGIINIVLKKETRQGVNGQITVNVGNEERYNGNILLNYGAEDFNVFGTYSIRHSNRKVYYSDQRTNRDSTGMEVLNYFDETGNSRNNSLSHVISAGAGYELNDNNSMELSGTWYIQNTTHTGVSEICKDDSYSQPISRITSNQTNDEYEHEGEASFAWEHIFGEDEDHTFALEAAFAAYDEEEDQIFDEQQTYPDPENTTEKILIQKSGNQTEVTVEYARSMFEDAELEAGYMGEFINEDICYTNNFSPDRFLLTQNVHALYALWG
nr:TonB-dependent receptor [Bacteroidota bacterium]